MDLAFFFGFAATFRLGDQAALSLLIVPLALAAILMRPRRAWLFAAAIVVIHAILAIFFCQTESARPVGSILPFVIGGGWLTYFLTELRRTLSDGEMQLQAALDDHARNERLVALGIQAAGIAHELGTPLSSIDMLAAEASSDPEYADEALTLLRAQVKRCRGILDRVRGSTVKTVSAEVEELGPYLREWIFDWTAAGLDREAVFTEFDPRLEQVAIRGAADEWRGIIWSALDNALKAGAPIAVRATIDGALVLLQIDDSGPGPVPDVAKAAGEPFFTSWTGGGGRGLGLYVARTFARKHGGDVALSRRDGGGGRLEIRFVMIGSVPSSP
jgi:two-component system sensor histidine kinase RegB